MKKFALAAVAILSLSVGSAFAAQPVHNQLNQTLFGTDYSADAGSVGG
jgi:hypothetical protein